LNTSHLVTGKATQLDAALDRVPPEVLDGALMVPLLNGVEHMAVLRARYPGACVIAATIRVESTRVGPGEVLHESPFASVVLAADNGAVMARVQRVSDVLKRVGVDVEVAGNESAVLWASWVFWPLLTDVWVRFGRAGQGGARRGWAWRGR